MLRPPGTWDTKCAFDDSKEKPLLKGRGAVVLFLKSPHLLETRTEARAGE